MCYSFNHQIRFNNIGEYNSSRGKDRSHFNQCIQQNLKDYLEVLHLNRERAKIQIHNLSFEKIPYYIFKPNDFLYFDPPYWLTSATYHDGSRCFGDWTKEKDKELFRILDQLNARKIPFALSNVIEHHGESYPELVEWSKQYNIIPVPTNYKNCNYQKIHKNEDTLEVLITNF